LGTEAAQITSNACKRAYMDADHARNAGGSVGSCGEGRALGVEASRRSDHGDGREDALHNHGREACLRGWGEAEESL